MGNINDYSMFHVHMVGYQVSDEDVDSSDGDITYTLYTNNRGEWYIMKEDISVGGDADLKAWRFIKGATDSSTNWTGREGLTYDTFENTFK